MTLRTGGYAVARGKTKGFRKLPLNNGDFQPSQMVNLAPGKLMLLTDTYIRHEPSVSDPNELEEIALWMVWIGEERLWVYEDAIRPPQRTEVPQEFWSSCGL